MILKFNFQPFRLDRTDNRGGIMLILEGRNSIKTYTTSLPRAYRVLFSGNKSKEKKWLLVCNYNPHKTLVRHCLECISEEIDSLATKYDHILLLVDFNSESTEEAKSTFLANTQRKNLNK